MCNTVLRVFAILLEVFAILVYVLLVFGHIFNDTHSKWPLVCPLSRLCAGMLVAPVSPTPGYHNTFCCHFHNVIFINKCLHAGLEELTEDDC